MGYPSYIITPKHGGAEPHQNVCLGQGAAAPLAPPSLCSATYADHVIERWPLPMPVKTMTPERRGILDTCVQVL